MSSDKLKETILEEMVFQEVPISNNKLLLLTGSFNYFIDSKGVVKQKNILRIALVRYLEHKLDTCGIMKDEEKDEELRDLKHESLVTILKLTKEQIWLLIEGLDHFMSNESQHSKKYLEIKDHLEKELGQ